MEISALLRRLLKGKKERREGGEGKQRRIVNITAILSLFFISEGQQIRFLTLEGWDWDTCPLDLDSQLSVASHDIALTFILLNLYFFLLPHPLVGTLVACGVQKHGYPIDRGTNY